MNLVNNVFYHLGRYFIMISGIFARPEKVSMYRKEIFRQMNDIGIGSLMIIALVSVFLGAVTAVQFSYQLGTTSIPIYYIGYIVRDMMIIELAPTFSCLMLAGKVGSNMTSEIGGMRQREQIDALEIMGVDTIAYLILPRLLGAITMIPLLVIVSAFIGIAGGYLAGIGIGFITHAEYMQGLHSFFMPFNVAMMLVKSFVFAFLVSTISCYQGFYVKTGSIELGKASTRAVVISNVSILLSDYLIATAMT